jgi:Protein of unknown function (DUF2917)
MERIMKQPSPQFAEHTSLHGSARPCDDRLPKVAIHFEVQPGATLTWRVEANAELAVQRERVWLTRESSPYDHWLQPGQPLQLQRGERVWISTDSKLAARVVLATYPHARRGIVSRWLERLSILNPDIYAPHSR